MSKTPNLDRLIDPSDVSVPEGWTGLVERMAVEILAVSPDVRLSQVKSKFGGLRAYLAPSESLNEDLAERVARVISWYEAESFRTCEKCGQPGAQKTVLRGWVQTLCAVHEVMGR